MNVYDFDNTIYDGESAVDFFFFYLKRDPSLIKYLPRLIHALYKYKRGKISIEKALNNYGGKVSDYYKKMTDTTEAVVEFWNRHEKKIKPFYKELHREDDLIISGSPEFSLEEICKRLGINHYIGTVLDKDTGEILRLCFRENKVKAFREIYGDCKIDNLYTDSLYDMPLAELATNAYLVKGSKLKKIK